MYLFNYILLAGFVCLLFIKDTRFAASVFLGGWAVYIYAVLGLSEVNYYALSGTIECAIAYSLNKKHRLVSYLGYSLVVYNFVGFLVHSVNTEYPYYDIGYAIISVTQFLFLLARALPNGLNRLPAKHPLVRVVNFDSRKAYGIMYKNTQTQGKNR